MQFKSFTVALAVLTLTLSACSKVPARPTGAPVAPAGTSASTGGPLRIMVLSQNPGDRGALDVLIGAYYAQYPNTQVDEVTLPANIQGVTGDQLPSVVKQALTTDPVDLIVTGDQTDLNLLTSANLVVPLDSGITSHAMDLLPLGSLASQNRIDGKLYDLPYVVWPYALFYNPAVFKQAGVAAPYGGWTWDQFRQTARQLTSGSGPSKVWGLSAMDISSLVSVYLRQQSPDKLVTDQQTLEKGIAFFQTMIHTDQSLQSNASSNYALDTGKTAMAFATWPDIAFYGNMTNANAWDVAPMPVSPGGTSVSMAHAHGLALAAGSVHTSQAWQFLQFATGEQGASVLAAAGYVPAYRSDAVKRAWRSQAPPPPANTEWVFDTTWHILPFPQPIRSWTPREIDAWVEVRESDLINQVLGGTDPFNDAYSKFAAEVEAFRRPPAK